MTTSNGNIQQPVVAERKDEGPWWRQGYCWLVFIGPLVVVVAGIATAVIAFKTADDLAPEYAATHHLPASMHPARPTVPGLKQGAGH
ncbi:hypothetical protein [Uliginosibacterium sediminicola]|uniref:Nitrogen fixation protein FixH n=1 Tax=Uliginosibacterium sediminicola TaxID=2024550 RepID=A0ABU9YZX0_9RHOO